MKSKPKRRHDDFLLSFGKTENRRSQLSLKMLNSGLCLYSFGFLEGQEDGESEATFEFEPHCLSPLDFDHDHLNSPNTATDTTESEAFKHNHQLSENYVHCMGVGFGTVLRRTGAECCISGNSTNGPSLYKVKYAAVDLSGVHCIQDNGHYVGRVFTENAVDIMDSSGEWSCIYCGENHIIVVNGSKLAHLYKPDSGAVSLNICVSEVACGKEHVILLDEMGRVFTIGNGSRGQLGHGDLESHATPKVVDLLEGLVCVRAVAGGWHSCVLTDCGDLFTWGWNQSGQLGILDGSTSPDSTADLPDSSADANRESELGQPEIVDESIASAFSMAPEIDDENNGTVVQNFAETDSLVRNSNAEEGASHDEKTVELVAPECKAVPVSMLAEPTVVDIDGGRPVLDVACGSRHTVALTADPRLYVWGWNKYGQLGLEGPESVYTPTLNSWFTRKRLVVRRVHAGYWTTVVEAQSSS